MSEKQFSLRGLMSGMQERNVSAETKRLVEKWNSTGLLRGLKDNNRRETMSRLLENQAAQMLREANALTTGGGAVTDSGQIRGFSNIAFPIVRRVFGGLVANELVSVQAMSLPSGLLFYLDYTYGSNVGMDSPANLDGNPSTQNTYKKGQSIYNSPTGAGVQSGSLGVGGQYDLVGHGYSRVQTGSMALNNGVTAATGDFGAWTSGSNAWSSVGVGDRGGVVSTLASFTSSNSRYTEYDPQLAKMLDEQTGKFLFGHVDVAALTTAIPALDMTAIDQIAVTQLTTEADIVPWPEAYQAGTRVLNLRRQNKRGNWSETDLTFTPAPSNGTHIQMVFYMSGSDSLVTNARPAWGSTSRFAGVVADGLDVNTDGSTLTLPAFESNFGNPPSAAIPEIDIKIESVAVTAQSRKLRARWSPELAQDLNAYHSMDAEVELTQILSEQIALDIDREILSDLLTRANGANFFWSRSPGNMVNKETGSPETRASTLSPGPAFTGTVREWYETLCETIIDVANVIHRKTLRGSANFIVTSPEVCTIFEASMVYKPNLKIDGAGQVGAPFQIGAEPVGSLSNRFTVYKDPYFPRNKVLVGFKGGSYLETGYVYAPYVPLIVTPTIFGPDDFAPRKGCMTRYGKRMVRSDFYGTVTIADMDVI